MTDGQTRGDAQSCAILRDLCNDLRGQICSAWRKGYRFTGSLHFGAMQPIAKRFPGIVDSDRGMMRVSLWGCSSVLLSPAGADLLDSRSSRDENSLQTLHGLVGANVSTVEFDDIELTLELVFSDEHRLLLSINSAQTSVDDEQWAVGRANGCSAGVFGQRLIRTDCETPG